MAKKRTYGTGGIHEKHGSYYGRWRTLDGRQLNRLVGPVRPAGSTSGLTRSQAEAAFRRIQDEEERAPRPARGAVVPTVDEVTNSLRKKLRLRGLRRSYLDGCESMQRVHISPRLGSKPVSEVKTAHIEALASSMLDRGLAPKTVRNVMTFLHSIFEHAIDRRLMRENPVRRATRPGRRRQGDANPDLQFLTVEELDAVIRAIPKPGRPPPAGTDSSRPAWARATAAARRAGTGSRPDPRRGAHRPAPERAPRSALARHRLGRAAHPGAQHVRAG